MARVKLIQTKDDMAPEHHALFDELAALRGRISGPSSVVLYSPRLARPWNEISEYLHRSSVVEARHAELAVCTAAREYDCAYIWAAHLPQARRAVSFMVGRDTARLDERGVRRACVESVAERGRAMVRDSAATPVPHEDGESHA